MATEVANGISNEVKSGDDPFAELSSYITVNSYQFLRPTPQIQQAALRAAKAILDPLAVSVADTQAQRRTENRRKRKRGDNAEEEPVLQLRQVYTKGFGVKQVWEQARRVLDAACYEVTRDTQLHDAQQSTMNDAQDVNNEVDQTNLDEDDLSEGEEELDIDEDDLEDESSKDDLDPNEEEMEGDEDLDELEDIEMGTDNDLSSSDEAAQKQEIFIPDRHGLNDGFFSIDDFNKQSQFLEQMDARGDDDNPSDEDDIDWDADPLSMSSIKPKPGKAQKSSNVQEDENDDDDESDGPTFGNANLEMSGDDDDEVVDEDGEGLEDSMGLSNANEVRYADFFEPPAKKPSKTKRMRALPKTQPDPQSGNRQQDEEHDQVQNDIERAMADVRRDLLDSDEEDLTDEDANESDDSMAPRKPKASGRNMSTHEKQRAAIAAEIRELEAANVAKRDWQLSGEARAADRPLNSLIEEDLEFERAGKPVPVVTAETSEEIEQLIKRRIIAREFDEVIRRQPGAIGSASETRRGRVEVDDTKPQAGLGEIYEQEHLKTSDPLAYVDKRSAATKKQHEQIDVLWRQVRDQLDALSNLHFKPKRADVEMKTVEDKPRIAMEDARPVGDLEAGEGGMLAPQEVYKPGVDSRVNGREEVMIGKKTGATVNREEMTREEKLRRRRREKERTKKAAGNQEQIVLGKSTGPNKDKKALTLNTKKNKGKEQDKANIIEDLKRGGVKVIGKGGELQTLEKGKKGKSESRGEVLASNLKL